MRYKKEAKGPHNSLTFLFSFTGLVFFKVLKEDTNGCVEVHITLVYLMVKVLNVV